MTNEIFKFSEQDFKQSIVYENKLIKKLRYSFDYLLKYLPINVVDDNFTFDNIKFREGKNYDWFFLVKDNIQLLVRQYSSHFTIICVNKDKEISYRDRMSVFTINDDYEKMDDEINDTDPVIINFSLALVKATYNTLSSSDKFSTRILFFIVFLIISYIVS